MAASDASNELSKSVAKWLIPSFGVLFALVGYVVHMAHRSLLGFPAGADGAPSGGYATDAADFLRYVLTLVGDEFVALASFRGVPLGGHGLAVALCGLAAAAAVGYAMSKYGRADARRATRVLGVVLFVLLSTKFVSFDAPLMRIENVIVGVGIAGNPGTPEQARTQPFSSRVREAGTGPVDTFIAGRATEVWRLLVCSRIGVPVANNPEFGGKQGCKGGTDGNKRLLRGEFNVQLLFGLMIALCGTMLLRFRAPAATAAALLAFAYLLTVPYAYGKLVKPVDFVYALVRFAPESLRGQEKKGEVYAFVVSRTSGDATLLEAIPEQCSTGDSTVLRFSSLPMSKVAAIEQIYLRDVFTWAVLKQSACPTLSRYPQPAKR